MTLVLEFTYWDFIFETLVSKLQPKFQGGTNYFLTLASCEFPRKLACFRVKKQRNKIFERFVPNYTSVSKRVSGTALSSLWQRIFISITRWNRFAARGGVTFFYSDWWEHGGKNLSNATFINECRLINEYHLNEIFFIEYCDVCGASIFLRVLRFNIPRRRISVRKFSSLRLSENKNATSIKYLSDFGWNLSFCTICNWWTDIF